MKHITFRNIQTALKIHQNARAEKQTKMLADISRKSEEYSNYLERKNYDVSSFKYSEMKEYAKKTNDYINNLEQNNEIDDKKFLIETYKTLKPTIPTYNFHNNEDL